MIPAISIHGLSKTYRMRFTQNVDALRDVSLEVDRGEVFGLLGPNGAGKTTLIKLLLGVVSPTAGTARLLDAPIDQARARLPVGYLPENHRFPGHLTAGQMLDVYARLARVDAAARRKNVPELLERVGMTRWRDVKLKKFSKGMLQRVGLAQALMNEPAIVFLDEPTDGVDPIGRREIRDLLLWLRERGTTIFLNSHLLSEVERICTRIAILKDGQLIRRGTVRDLTATERTYVITCTDVPPALLHALDGTLVPDAGDDASSAVCRYRAQVAGRRDLNEVLDQLRSHDVEIESVQPLRVSLEDYFIQSVGNGEADAPHLPVPDDQTRR